MNLEKLEELVESDNPIQLSRPARRVELKQSEAIDELSDQLYSPTCGFRRAEKAGNEVQMIRWHKPALKEFNKVLGAYDRARRILFRRTVDAMNIRIH